MFCAIFGVMLAVVVILLLLPIVLIGVLALREVVEWRRTFDDFSERRMFERLAHHTLKQALAFGYGSEGYKRAMALGRYYAHRAGYENGFTDDELRAVGL